MTTRKELEVHFSEMLGKMAEQIAVQFDLNAEEVALVMLNVINGVNEDDATQSTIQ